MIMIMIEVPVKTQPVYWIDTYLYKNQHYSYTKVNLESSK